MYCSVAAEEQTVSIDVMDVSDYDGDDNDMHDEVASSPRPPSQPWPPSHADQSEVDESQTGLQDTGAGLPQVTLIGRRVRGRSRDSQHNELNVCNMVFLYLRGLCCTVLCCSVFLVYAPSTYHV